MASSSPLTIKVVFATWGASWLPAVGAGFGKRHVFLALDHGGRQFYCKDLRKDPKQVSGPPSDDAEACVVRLTGKGDGDVRLFQWALSSGGRLQAMHKVSPDGSGNMLHLFAAGSLNAFWSESSQQHRTTQMARTSLRHSRT